MDNSPVNGDVDSISDTGYTHLDAFSSHSDAQNLENAVKVVMRLDMDLTDSSEKLSNLHLLLMHILAWNNDLDGNAIDGNFPEEFIEKALEFEYLSVILGSEVREVDSFLDTLPAEIVDARRKISSCRRFPEVCVVMEEKLRKCEASLKQSQIQVSEVKLQVAKMLHNSIENWAKDRDSFEDSWVMNLNLKQNLRTSQLPKYAIRMLEKSLARELALEKSLTESRQTELDLKTKLHYTEQVAFHMEEAAGVVWGRFLEAENASEVLMGISKDLAGRLQVVQFNRNSFARNEAALKSQLEDFYEQMKQKDVILKDITADYQAKSFEVITLQEKIKMLGEKLKESNAELENSRNEMENYVDSLKENIETADSRADDAENRAAQLTETNLELTEELSFIKGNLTSKSEKLTILEKQLREADMHLQHARVSSEAGQEQQNMLYSAIWDMETLIEDLKSKVSKAENRAVIAEEINAELNEELSVLRGEIEKLETRLDEVNSSKNAGAEEIQLRVKAVMDMVVQLAYERDRIQKQFSSLVEEKTYLMEKLREANGYSFTGMNKNRDDVEPGTNRNVPSGNTLSEDGLLPSTPI